VIWKVLDTVSRIGTIALAKGAPAWRHGHVVNTRNVIGHSLLRLEIREKYIMFDVKAKKLIELLNKLPVSKWGVADISGLDPFADEYPKAISLILAYIPDFETYEENKYHDLLVEKRFEFEKVINKIEMFLKEEHIKYYIVPQIGQDSKTLKGIFSHKLAATRAGLGWIGKNSLLITNEYGPRVRLATILIDYDVPSNNPTTSSFCGDCKICIETCPYGFINNIEWYPGIDRESLFNVFDCYLKRREFKKKIGRKHTCGLCLLACPKGK